MNLVLRLQILVAVHVLVCGGTSIRDAALAAAETLPNALSGPAWSRHTIDGDSRGADGVRVADVNGDGLLDFTTGWEEGGLVRVYLNPGPNRARKPWPVVTVGEVKSPEDAVFADLDGDGACDVVSSCEGRNRTMFVHWAPSGTNEYLNGSAWKTDPIPATQAQQAWMFALPLQIDGRGPVDLVVASKSKKATVGWLQLPESARDVGAWRFHKLYDAGWIMSLAPADMDGDGDTDVVVSDRKGGNCGVLWLENPGPHAAAAGSSWREHRIGASGREVMFLDVADLDRDGRLDVAVAVKPAEILLFRQATNGVGSWRSQLVPLPAAAVGSAKAVRVADIDTDGRWDLVFSCEHAKTPRSGVVWLSEADAAPDGTWDTHDISGPEGVKFDLLQTIDLDADGDLDVVTCEEAENLGVFWYENPTH